LKNARAGEIEISTRTMAFAAAAKAAAIRNVGMPIGHQRRASCLPARQQALIKLISKFDGDSL